MNYPKINDNFSLSGALSFADLCDLKKQGIDIIINSRLDGEDPEQICSEDYRRAVESLGMQYVFIPVTSLEYSPEALSRFAAAVANPGLKVHAFCRTGKRVAHLWALSQANNKPLKDILAACAQAGVDISPKSLESEYRDVLFREPRIKCEAGSKNEI